MHRAVAVNASPASVRADSIFDSYARLIETLLGETEGLCLLDAELRVLGERRLRATVTAKRVRALGWLKRGAAPRSPASEHLGENHQVILLPLEAASGALVGVLGIRRHAGGGNPSARDPGELLVRLRPAIECLIRELGGREPVRGALREQTERASELEWLFNVTQSLGGSREEPQMIEGLLEAATGHLKSALGVLLVPDRRLCIEHVRDSECEQELRQAWLRTRGQLMAWVQRHRRPLVVNGAGRAAASVPRCKILCVPITPEHGRVIGLMAFFNAAQAPDYRSRHIFLVRHLGRHSASLIEAQFDPMSGLLTRAGLEQMYARLPENTGDSERTVLYLDVDQMHVVNELFGFELGNEVLVRVGDLLGPPHLPEQALAARLAGDRFAVVLANTGTREAVAIAERLKQAIARISIGPTEDAVEISVSCGVAALLPMPQGLARALAAAEVTCKTAKQQGRNRIKVDTCDDGTMLRHHVDAAVVGQLRAALKSDRLRLYAQRIAPLGNPRLAGGYEILLRLHDPLEGVVAPGPLVKVAQRYQLLPSVDRWVTRRALQMLVPHRNLLKSRGLTVSINLSGQSIGDEEFTCQLIEELQAARLPPGSLMFEITEQAAVTNLARAAELIRRLAKLNCRFALDDFGTGSNSLTYLKALPIARVKIDGSFVRDLLTNPRSQATVRGIIELARGMSVDTVAEYVESEALAERVRELGVDYGQGYVFGRPEPLEAVLEALAHEESQRLHRMFLEA